MFDLEPYEAWMPIRAYKGVVCKWQNMFCAHETPAIYCGQVPKGIYGVFQIEYRASLGTFAIGILKLTDSVQQQKYSYALTKNCKELSLKMSASELLQTMYDSPLGTSLAESLYVYPLVEGVHLLSLAFSFGLIVLTDLRLIGVAFRHVPVGIVLQQLRPWLLGGFIVTFITGILLTFAAGPGLVDSPIFPLKLLLILFAGLNALWFEFKFGRSVINWGGAAVLPAGAKVAGWVSLVSWSLVVILGRLIPYLDSGF